MSLHVRNVPHGVDNRQTTSTGYKPQKVWTPPPPCDIPSGCCFFTGPWTVTRSSLRVLSLRSVGRCGWCSCWCRFRVRAAQSLVCQGCAGCGRMCRLRVSGAQWLAYWGLCWLLRGSFDCFCCPHTSVLRPSTTCLAPPLQAPSSRLPDPPSGGSCDPCHGGHGDRDPGLQAG